jgi:hypothetical protein
MKRGKDLGPWAVFGVPLILGGLALIGLVGALLENGLWDGLGAALLATSAVAVVWTRFRRR